MAPLLRLLYLLPAVLALPTALVQRESSDKPALSPWDAGAITSFPIHSSCNATQRRQIEAGLNEAIALADHAKAHILRWGNSSDIYRKYFGDRASMEAIGAYDVIVNGDKRNMLFRCDNPDGNCNIEGYGGHWRGANATGETVICDRSYTTRRSLLTMCAQGYTVSAADTNTFWAADLLHRLYHMPAVGQAWIEHFADGHEEVLALADGETDESTRDSETLQYFALEAYAFDVAVPGVGCPGKVEEEEHEHEHGEDGDATKTQTESATTSADVPKNCHTHEGGELHCT